MPQEIPPAHKVLNTPVDDAIIYLNNGEYKEYLKSINGAVLAYMEKRGAYKDDSRSVDYRKNLSYYFIAQNDVLLPLRLTGS